MHCVEQESGAGGFSPSLQLLPQWPEQIPLPGAVLFHEMSHLPDMSFFFSQRKGAVQIDCKAVPGDQLNSCCFADTRFDRAAFWEGKQNVLCWGGER